MGWGQARLETRSDAGPRAWPAPTRPGQQGWGLLPWLMARGASCSCFALLALGALTRPCPPWPLLLDITITSYCYYLTINLLLLYSYFTFTLLLLSPEIDLVLALLLVIVLGLYHDYDYVNTSPSLALLFLLPFLIRLGFRFLSPSWLRILLFQSKV